MQQEHEVAANTITWLVPSGLVESKLAEAAEAANGSQQKFLGLAPLQYNCCVALAKNGFVMERCKKRLRQISNDFTLSPQKYLVTNERIDAVKRRIDRVSFDASPFQYLEGGQDLRANLMKTWLFIRPREGGVWVHEVWPACLPGQHAGRPNFGGLVLGGIEANFC